MTDFSETPVGTSPRALGAYTALTLLTPSLIAGVLCVFDLPQPTWQWATTASIVIVLTTQQILGVMTSEVWPGPELRLGQTGQILVGPLSLALAVPVSVVTASLQVASNRPPLVWSLLIAAALGVAVLRLVSWDRERPQLSLPSMVFSLAAVALAVVAMRAASRRSDGSAWLSDSTAPVVLGAILFCVATLVGQVWWDRIITELTRGRSEYLARQLHEERQRFSGELHDLQGLELQRILTTADLGRNLLRAKGVDAIDDAISAFSSIESSARTTLKDARAIAHGYRLIGLDDEISNARGVLEAAGVSLEVRGRVPDCSHELSRLAGLFVREATTNIVRHSRATRATIDIWATDEGTNIVVVDNGPARAGRASGQSGLLSLNERAALIGYQTTAEPDGSGWRIALSPLKVDHGG